MVAIDIRINPLNLTILVWLQLQMIFIKFLLQFSLDNFPWLLWLYLHHRYFFLILSSILMTNDILKTSSILSILTIFHDFYDNTFVRFSSVLSILTMFHNFNDNTYIRFLLNPLNLFNLSWVSIVSMALISISSMLQICMCVSVPILDIRNVFFVIIFGS